ncbi:MAG: MarR family transcriptional regulator [Oscillospiraceae bacterium]|nr:MarR family transcriptional regulator [Oscillospiraceae bacterium]
MKIVDPKKPGSAIESAGKLQEEAGNDPLLLKNQLCFPLYAASRKIIRLYTPLLEPLGLTYTQYIALLALWERDGFSVKDLGERLFLDSGTLTPLLKKMEAEGLLLRKRDTKDERNVRIFLTDAGRALKERAAEIPGQMASCVPLTKGEAETLYRILYRLL